MAKSKKQVALFIPTPTGEIPALVAVGSTKVATIEPEPTETAPAPTEPASEPAPRKKTPPGKPPKKTKSKPAPAANEQPAESKKEEAKEKPLSAPQLRILAALSEAGRGMTGGELAEAAEVDPSAIGNQAGYRKPDINAREVHKFNLLNRGFVKLEAAGEGSRGMVYLITAAGKKALGKNGK
jgi:hypothetical protein